MVTVKESLFLKDTVLLKQKDRDVNKGGMIIPQNTSEDQFLFGEVVWVGPEVEYCRISHDVLYKRFGPTPIIIEGENYLMARESRDIEVITNYIKDGEDLNSLIINVQAKRLAKEFVSEISKSMPGIVEALKLVLINNTK